MYINIKKISALGGAENAKINVFGESEVNRLVKIKNDSRRAESESALAALGEIIEAEPKGEFEAEISRNANGRPCFVNDDADLSLSHSGDLAVAAFVRSGRIGVDVELVSDKRKARAVAERFFSEKEKRLISESSEPLIEFFKLWTRKEALAKCRNMPLAVSMSTEILPSEFFFSSFLVLCEGEQYVLSIACDQKIEAKITADKDVMIREFIYEQ